MPTMIYQYTREQETFVLSIHPSKPISLTHNFYRLPEQGEIPDDIFKAIEMIRNHQFDPKTNPFRLISPESQPERPRQIVPNFSLASPPAPISKPVLKDAPLGFFQNSKKFFSDHKNFLIAGALSGTIGAGIGLTLTYYDQMVSAAMITNTLLLGLLVGLITLICLMINEYSKQYPTAQTPKI